MLPVTVIITNYRTPALLKTCVESLLQHYPGIDVVLVDNGSHVPGPEEGGDSRKYIASMRDANDNVRALLLDNNAHHGPAMNLAVKCVTKPYFFTLDTDAVVLKPGFLESMLKEFDNPGLYAIGWLRWVHKLIGVSGQSSKTGVAYIHPHAALFDREKHVALAAPFACHGAPCLPNMLAAQTKGYQVKNFPIGQYIKHLGAGTRRMWGGAWFVRDKPQTSEWKANKTYPL